MIMPEIHDQLLTKSVKSAILQTALKDAKIFILRRSYSYEDE